MKLVDEIARAHEALLKTSITLADLRYKSWPGQKQPSLKQYEATVESAYWRVSNAANRLLPYLSALSLLEHGDGE